MATTSDPPEVPRPDVPPEVAEVDELEDSAEVRAALGQALRDELEGGPGVRYVVYLVIAAVVAGFLAMFYFAWQAIGG